MGVRRILKALSKNQLFLRWEEKSFPLHENIVCMITFFLNADMNFLHKPSAIVNIAVVATSTRQYQRLHHRTSSPLIIIITRITMKIGKRFPAIIELYSYEITLEH